MISRVRQPVFYCLWMGLLLLECSTVTDGTRVEIVVVRDAVSDLGASQIEIETLRLGFDYIALIPCGAPDNIGQWLQRRWLHWGRAYAHQVGASQEQKLNWFGSLFEGEPVRLATLSPWPDSYCELEVGIGRANGENSFVVSGRLMADSEQKNFNLESTLPLRTHLQLTEPVTIDVENQQQRIEVHLRPQYWWAGISNDTLNSAEVVGPLLGNVMYSAELVVK